MSGELRHVLWVDPNATQSSPSMKGLMSALPALRENGCEVEFWCLRCDAPEGLAKVRRLPAVPWLGTLENVWFVLVANVCYVLRSLYFGRPAQVVGSTGAYCLFADVVHAHFDSAEWLRVQARLGGMSWRDRLRRQITRIGAALEWMSWRSPWTRAVVAVSEGMAGHLRQRLGNAKSVRVLANPCDTGRFHPGARGQWRETMREQLGYDARACVFLFIATGHLQRKGFWSALRVLHRLRSEGKKEIRFLVVGGSDTMWQAEKKRIGKAAPDHEAWVTLAGSTTNVERFYAAADAFLLPSHFETDALVAQEALACGLPVFVTAYWGQEMYLRQGENGWLLPWDEDGMTAVLADALDQRPWQARTEHFIDAREYGRAWSQVFHELLKSPHE